MPPVRNHSLSCQFYRPSSLADLAYEEHLPQNLMPHKYSSSACSRKATLRRNRARGTCFTCLLCCRTTRHIRCCQGRGHKSGFSQQKGRQNRLGRQVDAWAVCSRTCVAADQHLYAASSSGCPLIQLHLISTAQVSIACRLLRDAAYMSALSVDDMTCWHRSPALPP